MTNHKIIYLLLVPLIAMLASCIEDGVSTDPASQPSFSCDTLHLGMVFTTDPSPTHHLTIYNRNSRIINLESVQMRSGRHFRINVDGISGQRITDVEIRPNDSIYVFVETTLPDNGGASLPVEVTDILDVVTNGVTRSVVIAAQGQDVERLRGLTVTSDTRFDGPLPYQIFDSLVVAPGACLTIPAGTTLYFHDGAQFIVDGTLHCDGTQLQPVVMRGDRSGKVAASIDFDIMSDQWRGIDFTPTSRDNRLTHTEVVNTYSGLQLDSLASAGTSPALTLVNCRIHNSKNSIITAYHSSVEAYGCQLSNSAAATVRLHGGSHRFDHCTIANFYLFVYPSEEVVTITHLPDPEAEPESQLPFTAARFTNSIIYGRNAPFNHDDLTGFDIFVQHCLMAVDGSDDDNFTDCLWNNDPKLDYDLRLYTFAYTPLPESPAIDAADSSLNSPLTPSTDLNGLPRLPHIGALAPTFSAE